MAGHRLSPDVAHRAIELVIGIEIVQELQLQIISLDFQRRFAGLDIASIRMVLDLRSRMVRAPNSSAEKLSAPAHMHGSKHGIKIVLAYATKRIAKLRTAAT